MIFLLACTVGKQQDSANEPNGLTAHLSWDVSEKGPYHVGYTTQNTTYSVLEQERETLINIWYPTEEDSGETAVYYSIVSDEESLLDAPWADPVTTLGYPVLIFSHGSFLYGGSSAFLPRHFASHGWVVAAPDHTGHLLGDFGDAVEASTFYLRPHNMKAAMDVLSSFASVHTENVVVSGFSFGATDNWMIAGAEMNMPSIQEMCVDGTVPSGCSDAEMALFQDGFGDSRVRAIVPMAGADRFEWISTQGRSNLEIPVLMISGTEDDDSPQTIIDQVEGTEITDFRIEGGCHQLFSVGGCSAVSTEDGYSMVRSKTLEFARGILFAE